MISLARRLVPLALLLHPLALAAQPARVAPPVLEAGRAAELLLERIAAAEPRLSAMVAINPDAPQEARAAAAAGLPLAGLPLLVKDNIETRELPTTAGSMALAGNDTGRDAPLIARLRAAGAVVLGKTNLSQWANFRDHGSTSGWSTTGGQVRNPHATDRSPCGSSSGSGAAVAAGYSFWAIGTETNGSITCPASVNGIVGLKPTVGLVSRTHIIPISASQDTAGPMASDVHAAATLLTYMAGSDPLDPATAEADAHAIDFTQGLHTASLAGVRIGVLRNQVGNIAGLTARFEQALADLAAAGAVLVEVAFTPDPQMYVDEFTALLYEFRVGIEAYLASSPADLPVRSLAELIAYNDAHARTELRWFGQELFRQALAATDREAYEAARANAVRLAGPEGIDRLLAEHDVAFLIAPTEGPAWPIDLVLGDRFLPGIGAGSLAAIAGYPHLTVPMGAVEGLPVGLSFIGPRWADHALLQAGAAYERVRSAPLASARLEPWAPR